jgi:hypothetical protein
MAWRLTAGPPLSPPATRHPTVLFVSQGEMHMKTQFATSIVLATAAAASAAPVIDGTLDAADGYGAPVKTYADNYINGSDASGGTNVVSTYFAFDDSKVYGAVKLDSGAAAFPGANIYVYSSSPNTNKVTGQPGVYGSGDDFILEGANGWREALGAAPWGNASQPYNASTIQYLFNGSDTVEFSIARSMLGDYDSFRYGGQLFAYEFHTGGDRVDGAIVAVPEPATLAAIAGGALLLLGRRRRRA